MWCSSALWNQKQKSKENEINAFESKPKGSNWFYKTSDIDSVLMGVGCVWPNQPSYFLIDAIRNKTKQQQLKWT